MLISLYIATCKVLSNDVALKAINNEFVYGFTQAMDGEKDPRNLMCAFKLIKIITDEFDIATHVEV